MQVFTIFFMPLIHLILGFMIGYLIATLIESIMHQYVSDAPKGRVKSWERYPRLFKYLIRTNYSHHVIHHRKTYKQNHITQFKDQTERKSLDFELESKGHHGKIIQKSNYAVKLHGSGSLVFVAPLLPGIPFASYFFNHWITIGFVAALLLPPLLSNYIHPYLHMPYENALIKAPALLFFLLNTWYFRAMARNHYMHHKYVASNFNLLLGGDIIRRTYRAPSQKDIHEMKQLGLPIH